MNERDTASPSPASHSADRMTALFHSMVMQQTNLALMLLGQVPNPETGQPMKDLEGARMFIDQLEMLESKTRGNLTEPEKHLLQQCLSTLRFAFIDAVNAPAANEAQPNSAPSAPASPAPAAAPPAEASENRPRFSKKY